MPAAVAAKLKDIREYYTALDAYAEQGVTHEGAVFQNLLAETGRQIGWTLIPELQLGSIRPDGTFRDEYFLNRGYWEARTSPTGGLNSFTIITASRMTCNGSSQTPCRFRTA